MTLLLGTGCSGKQPPQEPVQDSGPVAPESEAPAPEHTAKGSCTAVIEVDGYGTITLAPDGRWTGPRRP